MQDFAVLQKYSADIILERSKIESLMEIYL